MSMQRKQSNATYHLFFFMVDDTDHITGKTGLSPTVTISKNGASFGSPSGAVSEVGSGWYKVAGHATDSNTLGTLLLHATATGADPIDKEYEIVVFDPFDLSDVIHDAVVEALVTDTYAEPSSVPPATTSLKNKIGWQYMLSRNKLTQSSSQQVVRNDADSSDVATAAVADNGTVFTRGEYT